MNILALTIGDDHTASSHYRVFQYAGPLRAHGIILETALATEFGDLKTLRKYDLVLLQKKLLPGNKLEKLRRSSRKLVYDVDDAIWFPHGKSHHIFTTVRTRMRLRRTLARSDLCIAANWNLAAQLEKWKPRGTCVLPMALPARQWPLRKKPDVAEKIVLGWAGAPVNLPYLEALEDALCAVTERHPNATLSVYSGRKPAFKRLRFEHHPFKPGTEARVIRGFDVGLLPLPQNKFAAGKSPIKALQYFACGVPAVATPLGATREIVRDGETGLWAETDVEWERALERLVVNADMRRKLGARARTFFEEHHSLDHTAASLAGLLKQVAGTPVAAS